MATRSYREHCGLAAALDLVGQRWAMLIVRDLAPGPRRFTDLFDGLPGIATDMLSDRLRELEAAGVVVLESTRHPVPAKLYSLTERGEQLAAVLAQLADWGRPLLPEEPAEGVTVRARWALQTMVRMYRRGLSMGAYEFMVDGDELHVVVQREGASLHYGRSPQGPLASVQCSTRQFFQAVNEPGWLGRRHRGVMIDGEVSAAIRFFEQLPLQVGAAAAAELRRAD